MNNEAFKDLVQKQRLGPSTKEIARRAVEEEESRKQKKRRRRGGRGGPYESSSDEDDDDDPAKQQRNMKKIKDGEQSTTGDHNDVDDHKQQKEELASRYRDRAKERREGKDTQIVAVGDKKDDVDPYEFLIVPHNKKGLDLSLVRMERQGLAKAGSGTATESPSAVQRQNVSLPDDETPIVKELPDIVEAERTLRDSVAYSSPNIPASNMSQNRSVLEYIRGLLDWTVDWNHTSKLDAVTCGTAGRTLQHTNYSMAIDGHPSDKARAWEVPRQVTRSGVSASGVGNNTRYFDASPVLITCDLLSQVDRVFQGRRRILNAMKKSTTSVMQHVEPIATKGHNNARGDKHVSCPQGRKGEIADPGGDRINGDDDDDDDIFGGGIGEYVPQLTVPVINEAHDQPDKEEVSDENDIFNVS